MSYQTYITEALVCGSRDNNTSDRSFRLFTRETGMLWASARSVRVEKSKQRYALQDLSHVRASLVSGKAGWRLAGVEPLHNLYFDAESREARGFVRNITRLLVRTIHGEERHVELFDDVIGMMMKCNEYDGERLELILSLRILYYLGYVSPDEKKSSWYTGAIDYDNIDSLAEGDIRDGKKIIEHALMSSQL